MKFDYLNGSPLSQFDFSTGEIIIYVHTEFNAGGAVLTGPGVGQLVIGEQQYGLGASFTARARKEGEWFDAMLVPGVITTHRHRVISIDTP